jgi:hypothetical protein
VASAFFCFQLSQSLKAQSRSNQLDKQTSQQVPGAAGTKCARRNEDDQMLSLISLSRSNKIRQEKKCVKKFTQ